MKFSRTALIKACDEEIAARVKVAEQAVTDAEADYERQKAEWLASDHPQAIATACRAVLDKIRKGRIITTDDLGAFNVGYRSANHAFSPVKPKRETKARQPQVEKLTALRDFLAAVTDDEVTSSGLRDVGFRNIAATLKNAASA